jgi:hypothetical protein
MYSRCSFHWTHMRIPSSKKVETRQKRARCGRICFVLLVTYKLRLNVNFKQDYFLYCIFVNIISLMVPFSQYCGSETFHYGSGSDFSGSRINFQNVPDPVSDPNFFLEKYDFKGPKMAFQNIILKQYLNLV